MENLYDIIGYILLNISPNIATKYRVTKMIYLADWCSCVSHNTQITNIHWVFDNYGPFVWDIYNTVEQNPDTFKISYGLTIGGNEKMLFSLVNPTQQFFLTNRTRKILDFIVNETKKLSTIEFTQLVYNTYPILTTPRYNKLDLIKKAQEFNKRGKQ